LNIILLYFFLDSQRIFPLNRGKNDPIYEPYFLLPPLKRFDYEKPNEKMNFQPMDRLPHVSSTLNNDRESCSTPNTFMETPHNFSIDDYRLNQSIKVTLFKIYFSVVCSIDIFLGYT
jgi:hypothetical protein